MIATYLPNLVAPSFAGALIVGLVEDAFIEVSRTEDAVTLDIGVAGDGARSVSKNRSGTITLRLMQWSPSNDFLSALEKADEMRGAGAAPFFLKDLNGLTLVTASNAWIQKLPTLGYGREFTDREWVFASDYIDIFVGGILPR